MSRRATAVFCLATALSTGAQAQDGDSTELADASNWQGESELGVLITSGNTDETNVNARLGVKHEVTKWRNTGEFRSNYSETEDNTTAEKYRVVVESDYKFAERQFWFLRASYEDDRFSGYEYESSLTTGYGNRVWSQGDRSFLDLTIGAGYRFDKLEQPDADGNRDEDDPILRLAGHYDKVLSETALFRQLVSVERGFDTETVIFESETSLQANIVGSLSMKAAYRVQHISDPPGDAEETDTEVSVSLLYGF